VRRSAPQVGHPGRVSTDPKGLPSGDRLIVGCTRALGSARES